MTYTELEGRVGQIARALHDLGCGRGDRVALLLERGVDFASAVLAVLRLGAAYVAVDPRAPSGRIEYILADARCRVVLTEGPPAEFVRASGLSLLQLETVADVPIEDGTRDEPLPVAGG